MQSCSHMAISRSTLKTLKNLHRSPRVSMNSTHLPSIFHPPTNRSMRNLDRSFFQKTIPIAAATVFDDRNISAVRGQIERAGNSLGVTSLKAIVVDETVPGGRKCMLLRPGIVAAGLFVLFSFFVGLDCGSFWVLAFD